MEFSGKMKSCTEVVQMKQRRHKPPFYAGSQRVGSFKSGLRLSKSPKNQGLIVIRYYLVLQGAENGVTKMVTPFFCVQG